MSRRPCPRRSPASDRPHVNAYSRFAVATLGSAPKFNDNPPFKFTGVIEKVAIELTEKWK